MGVLITVPIVYLLPDQLVILDLKIQRQETEVL